MIYFNKKNRRHFLIDSFRGVTTALALPFLGSLVPEKSWAGGPGRKKFIALAANNGVTATNWEPFLSANPSGDPRVRVRNLSDFAATGISKTFGTEFSPYLNKTTFIKGLDIVPSQGHNQIDGPLGNFVLEDKWSTIDQVLAYSSRFYQGDIPALPSIHIDVSNWGGMSARWLGGAFVTIPPYSDPNVLFKRIFFSTASNERARNVKIIDRVKSSSASLLASGKLGASDKLIVQNYFDLLSQTENRIKGQRPLEAAKPAAPMFNPNSRTERYRIMNDLIVLALNAGATQVASMSLRAIPYLDEPDGFTEAQKPGLDSRGLWHEVHHDTLDAYAATTEPVKLAAMLTYAKWSANTVVLDLVRKLDSIVEGNGKTMLDNSLLLYGNEIAYGVHEVVNMPVVIFGGAGGALTPGRLLDYTRYNATPVEYGTGYPWLGSFNSVIKPGRMYNQLLVSMMQSMGLQPGDYERPGRPGYGAITSLNPLRNQTYAPVLSDHSQMLPLWKV